jgi:predicted dehydrogenase
MTTIAIIGQGYMGRTHAESWSNLGYGERIKYVCTPRPGKPLERAPKATFVTELDIVLRDPELDVISVCTPTITHRDITVRALQAGKNVLLEKPIALTMDDALAIQAAAEASGAVLMVAQVVRFFEGYRLLREDVAAGKLGTVLAARGRRLVNRPDWAEWWHDESKSGGVVVDFAIHDYDQMNLFLGEPVAVTCVSRGRLGPVETTIEYHGGGIGQVLSFADTLQGVPFTSSIGLVGSEGIADYEFSAGSPTEQVGTGEALPGVNTYRLRAVNDAASVVIEGDAPYTRQAEYFLQCVDQGAQPELSTVASAIRALEVSLAAKESIATGTRVPVNSRVSDSAAFDIARQ